MVLLDEGEVCSALDLGVLLDRHPAAKDTARLKTCQWSFDQKYFVACMRHETACVPRSAAGGSGKGGTGWRKLFFLGKQEDSLLDLGRVHPACCSPRNAKGPTDGAGPDLLSAEREKPRSSFLRRDLKAKVICKATLST